MDFVYEFSKYFSLFLIYSFLGWCFEVFLEFIKKKKFINRGFLIGPIIPIWGFGAVFITILCPVPDSMFSLIISSAFIGTFLEYIVNYLMEKLFKARWWDYSHLPFNLNGRVWLGSSLLFGVGGFFVINYFNPFFLKYIEMLGKGIVLNIDFIILLILCIDIVLSCNIITKLKLSADSLKKDYTEEVSKKVKKVLEEKSVSFSRVLKAFPDVRFNFKRK